MELLVGVASQLRLPEHDGDPAAFGTPPTVTVVRHSDGSAVLTDAATDEHGEGEDVYFTVDLTGAQLAEVDLLVATWTDGDSTYTTYAEVVGGFACSLRAIKAKYEEADRTDDQVAAAREVATTQIEAACGVAFRPCYAKQLVDGTGADTLMLPDPQLRRVLSVAVAGEALSAEELAELTVDHSGFLIHPSRWAEGRSNIEIAYVHGHEAFGPAALPVRDLASYLLTRTPTDWNARATSYSTGEVTYSLVTAGVRGMSFPLPEVNAFVQQHEYVSVG